MQETAGMYSSRITVRTIPLAGQIHFVWDIKGIASLTLIILYWIYGVWSIMSIVLLPRYTEGHVSFGFLVVYMYISTMCIISVFRAALTNPGRVPLTDQATSDEELNWTYCQVCRRKRPLKSHHCRRCQQCVLRMDHHCPWINNCVGEENHWVFMLVIIYSEAMSGLSTVLCYLHWYVYPKCSICEEEEFTTRHEYGLMCLSTILSGFMAATMFCMLVGQHFNLLMDRTTLDNMMDPFPKEVPYQKRPCLRIYKDLCGPGAIWMWCFPCRTRRLKPVYNYPQFPDMV